MTVDSTRRRSSTRGLVAVPPLADGTFTSLVHVAAVRAALSSGSADEVNATAASAGCAFADDGVALAEALDLLAEEFRVVRGTAPDFAATRALATGWSESTLTFLQGLACEEPVSGLASIGHVQTRLTELHRHAAFLGTELGDTHALLVVGDISPTRLATLVETREAPFARTLLLVRVAACIRSVFPTETIAHTGSSRVLVVVRRTGALDHRVDLVREAVADVAPGCADPRIWLEPLPPDGASTAALLTRLGR